MVRRLFGLLAAVSLPVFPALADSSSPLLLAAYYDRQMAIIGNVAYGWQGANRPKRIYSGAIQVGVGRRAYYVLTVDRALLRFPDGTTRSQERIGSVARFAAGRSGALAILTTGALWWLPMDGGKLKIADGVVAAAVGDGANYYVTGAGALFVKGSAHRGQYGDGRLTGTNRFVMTAENVIRITAHTGHAILMTKAGDVLGTGGNIYGPVGRHGLGDKAVRWSRILSGAKAIATGSSHMLAILRDGRLMAWGAGYGPDPLAIMAGVAAGSSSSIALMADGRLLQWARDAAPRAIRIP